jgi:hypothetical protein
MTDDEFLRLEVDTGRGKMTELSFLLELILNHKLPKTTKKAIRDRIGEIQMRAIAEESAPAPPRTYSIQPVLTKPQPMMPEKIAQTPEAQQALNNRQAMINAAMSRKPLPGTDHAPKSHGKL